MADYNKSGNLPITASFVSSDPIITGHVWKLNGTVIPEATGNTFSKTFTSYGDYSIEHSGSNSCGSQCTPILKTLTITPNPEQPVPTEVVYGIMPLGVVVLSMISNALSHK